MKAATGIAAAVLVGAAAVALTVPSVGLGQATGMRGGPDGAFYAGATLGRSKMKHPDDDDTAWRIFGGYRIHRHFAAELGYTDLGAAHARPGAVPASLKAKAWDLVGIGSYPITGMVAAYARLGLYRADTDATSNIGVSASESNTGFTYGFGGQYDFNRNLAARLEWQRYQKVGGGDIDKTDVDVIGLGVLWKFR